MTQGQDGVVLIKKYSNRRLYDTRRRSYITLENLAETVRSGAKVRVVDASSGSDITRAVLTQVILEQQERLDMIPVDLLHRIIQVQGTARQAPLTRMLSQWTQQLMAMGDAWSAPMNAAQSMMRAFSGFGMGGGRGRGPERASEAPGPVPEAPTPGRTPDPGAAGEDAAGAGAAEAGGVAALRDEMAELLARLGGS